MMKLMLLALTFLFIKPLVAQPTLPPVRTSDFNQVIQEKENDLDKHIKQYEEKYHKRSVLDLSKIGSKEFESHLKDLKVMEGKLDGLIKTEIDSLARAQLNFASELEKLNPALAPKAQELKTLYANYEASKVEYGGAKDFRRYAAFTDLFFKTKEVFDGAKLGTTSKTAQLLKKFAKTASKVKNLLNLSVRLSLPALQMLLSAFQNVTKTKIGFGGSVDKFFEKWGKISDISVEVKNHDILKEQKRLRLFVPTHRDANLDAVAFAALKVENPAVFGALNLKNHPIFGVKDNPLVKPLITSLESNDTFILAGAPEKPIDKFIRLNKENKVRNALIYPEGQVGLGLKESRPIRENFSEALLRRLVQENIDFELVPVTYVNGSQFFEYHNDLGKIKVEKGQEKLFVNVHKPITSTEIKKFMNTYGSKDLNTYLRFLWLFEMDTNQKEILGQGRWNNIQSAFNQKVTGKDCSQILKAFLKSHASKK